MHKGWNQNEETHTEIELLKEMERYKKKFLKCEGSVLGEEVVEAKLCTQVQISIHQTLKIRKASLLSVVGKEAELKC